MKIFNMRALSQRQRFTVAVASGLAASIVLGLLSGLFRNQVVDFSLLILLISYLIAMTIQKMGRGVQVKFSILGLLCTIIAIMISDVITQFGLLGLTSIKSFQLVIRFAVQNDIHSLLWIAYRLLAVYIGFNYSRII